MIPRRPQLIQFLRTKQTRCIQITNQVLLLQPHKSKSVGLPEYRMPNQQVRPCSSGVQFQPQATYCRKSRQIFTVRSDASPIGLIHLAFSSSICPLLPIRNAPEIAHTDIRTPSSHLSTNLAVAGLTLQLPSPLSSALYQQPSAPRTIASVARSGAMTL